MNGKEYMKKKDEEAVWNRVKQIIYQSATEVFEILLR